MTIGKIFDEADRRDPGHARTWIALVDGDNHQLGLIQAQAAARGITLAILVDFIHVLEYLWKAAWCFHPPRDPAMEDWVIAQGLDILHGRVTEVIARIARLAAEHPPRPGSEHAKIIRKTLSYLQNKQPYLDYPRALANGWPIATGVIEGACRHLVQDRMGITGARWGLEGAQAMLWLRAITASGDTAPTGTGTSPKNTSATTSAATRTASTSPPDPHSKRATPMSHSCSANCMAGTSTPYKSPEEHPPVAEPVERDRLGVGPGAAVMASRWGRVRSRRTPPPGWPGRRDAVPRGLMIQERTHRF